MASPATAYDVLGNGNPSGTCIVKDTTEKVAIFGGVTPVVQQSALTTELTDLTQAGTFTPDYAIQAITNSSPYGFANAAEGETVVKVVQANKVRIAEIEAVLEAYGLIAS